MLPITYRPSFLTAAFERSMFLRIPSIFIPSIPTTGDTRRFIARLGGISAALLCSVHLASSIFVSSPKRRYWNKCMCVYVCIDERNYWTIRGSSTREYLLDNRRRVFVEYFPRGGLVT